MKRKQSKHNQIKAHLKSGRSISGLLALHYYSVYRLSSVINRLRNEGLKIKTTMEYNLQGTSKYAFYSIIN